MKKPNKDNLTEIIGAIVLLALIGGTVACITYEPPKASSDDVVDYTLSN